MRSSNEFCIGDSEEGVVEQTRLPNSTEIAQIRAMCKQLGPAYFSRTPEQVAEWDEKRRRANANH